MLTSTYYRAAQIIAVSSFLAIRLSAFPALPDRITASIDGNRTITLQQNVPHQLQVLAAGRLADQGPLDAATKIAGMKLMLKQTSAQNAGLVQLLEEQRDPKSPSYHKWLTPEEFGERFGASSNDLAKLTAWLSSQGFVVQQVARAHNWITFDGPAASVANAFRTTLHRYASGTEAHFANAVEPSVPAALAGVVGSIRGLDDFHPKPQHRVNSSPKYTYTDGSHYLAPDDMAAIYDISKLYAAGIDGTGQKLAIVGQTDIDLDFVTYFRNFFGLSVNTPQLVLTGPDPGYSAGDAGESYLDLEWSGAIARNATILFVYSDDVFTSALYEIDQNLAPVMSMSYGYCEPWSGTSVQTWAQQANAEGITWMASAGDSGAASCDWDGSTIASNGLAVLAPADVPEITAVGGSEFNEGSTGWSSQNGPTQASATGYLPEMVWNDSALGYGLDSGGGGVSVRFSKPWWQVAPGVPNDGARDVPDVSLTASADHDGYLVWVGNLQAWGGTSASSPSFAGIVTLVNQYLVTQGIQSTPGLGNINPILYSLAQTSGGVFHDITVGNNMVPCTVGSPNCTTGSMGYSAGPGYDLASGLGSVDAYNLVTNWSSATPLVVTTTTLTASATSIPQTASVQLTATVTPASGTTTPSGTFTFTLAGNTIGSAAAVATAGTSAAATATIAGSSLSVGSNTITAGFVAAGVFSTSVASLPVTVTSNGTTTTLTASPTSISTTGSTLLSVTVKSTSGGSIPAGGGLEFFINGTSLGEVTVQPSGANGVASLTLTGSQLVTGSNSITANYFGSTGFAASTSAPVIVTVAPVTVSTTTALAASATSIPANGSTVLSVTVTPSSGTVSPTGTLTFKLGSTTLGSGTLAASGTKAVASLTVNGSSLATGANSITATYVATGNFVSSTSAAVTVTVTPALPATTIVATAAPASIAATASTVLTATVRPASGTVAPTGSVTFSAGSTVLGTALLKASGSTSSTTFTVKGSSLVGGANVITVSYLGVSTFAPSTTSVTVTLPSTAVATSTTVTASPASIAKSGTTQLVATVKPASGSGTPTGTVSFTIGATSLGSAALVSAAPGTSTATLALPGTNLAFNANTITAAYVGTSAFGSSSGSATLTITGGPVSTNLTLAASPASIASSASTTLSVTLTPASGSTAPTGSIAFLVGQVTLGTATLTASGSTAKAGFTVNGTSLVTGVTSITASYAGNSAFAGAAGSVSVTVTAPAKVATTLAATASPASIASTATTQLSITVTPASGSTAPTGSIAFALGQTSLGSATLTASGSRATAVLTLNGASLAIGANTISATYGGTTAFAGSAGSASVTVTAPAKVVTTLTATASPASLAPTATTQLSISVTPASGSTAPTGSIAFTLGQTSLGSATLTASGSKATAVFTLVGSKLASGANTITATYAGTTALAGSTGTVTVTIVSGSKVVVTLVKSSSAQPGFPLSISLQETAGVATTVTGWTMAGTNFSSVIPVSFGSTKLPAKGTLSTVSIIQWSPMPNPLVVVFTGADAGGQQWSVSTSIATK
jgi:subtilase family serine protease